MATTIPTHDNVVNSDGHPPTSGTYPLGSPFISPGLNEADEMNLYRASRIDAPFGPADLEWLYRFQDIDGASLNTSQPAPIAR